MLTDLPPYPVIAEAGACDGSVDWAIHAAIAAARAGCWGFKVQMYSADSLVTRTAPTYGKGLAEPETQHEAFRNAIDYQDWAEVKDACDELGIVFFPAVFDMEAIDVAMGMGVELFKIASADITYRHLLEAVGKTGKPVILSTGASVWDEIDRALGWLGGEVLPLVCTLSYPCPPEAAHLARIQELRKRSGLAVGYSDHTRYWGTVPLAFNAGARLVEKHFTISPGEGGDHDFALSPDEMAAAVKASGLVLDVRERPEWGTHHLFPLPDEEDAYHLARRSIHLARDVENGETITADDLAYLRPGNGMPPYHDHLVIGRTALVPLPAGSALRFSQVE